MRATCCFNVNKDGRKELFTRFWSCSSVDEQIMFIQKSHMKRKIKFSMFHVHGTNVCYDFFMKTLNVPSYFIEYALRMDKADSLQ